MKGAGCTIFTVATVAVIIGAAASIATGIYGAVQSHEQGVMQKNAANLSAARSQVAERMSQRNDRKSVEQAARMSADGTMLNHVMTKKAKEQARRARSQLRDTGTHSASEARPTRDFGVPASPSTVANAGQRTTH